MKSFRCDRMPATGLRRLDNGYVRFDMTVSRAGILVYRLDDGSEWREYRPASEAFDPESVATLAGVPVTIDHPPTLLSAQNTRQYMVGYTGDTVSKAGEYVATAGTLTDAEAILAMETGKQETSAGYELDLEFTPGEFEGERYDAIQRKIRYNHVALVERGRAGPGARVKMDSVPEKTYRFDSFLSADDIQQRKGKNMKVINIGGVDYQVSDEVESALVKKLRADADKLETVNTELSTVKTEVSKISARADNAEAQLKAAQDKVKELEATKLDDAAVQARVDARVALLTFALPRLDKATDWNKKTDREIKVALIQAEYPKVKFDGAGKDDIYLQGRLDAIMDASKEETEEDEEEEEVRTDSKTEAKKAAKDRVENNKQKTAAEIRAERQRADSTRWMKPLGYSAAK